MAYSAVWAFYYFIYMGDIFLLISITWGELVTQALCELGIQLPPNCNEHGLSLPSSQRIVGEHERHVNVKGLTSDSNANLTVNVWQSISYYVAQLVTITSEGNSIAFNGAGTAKL